MPDEKLTEQVQSLAAAFPGPGEGGKLTGADKEAMDRALTGLAALGDDGVQALIALIRIPSEGEDVKIRHALHALGMRTHAADDDARRKFSGALLAGLAKPHPAAVREFVIRQLQLVGGPEIIPVLGPLLLDDDLYDESAQALLAVGSSSAPAFRAALPQASGKQRLTVVHALGTLQDTDSAEALRPLARQNERDLRLTALWALANMGDAGSVEIALEAVKSDKIQDRHKAAHACLLLAEHLRAAGKDNDARRIYTQVQQIAERPEDAHIRAAADRGLAGG